MSEVLVVAGEASGDRIAALVARSLAARGVRCAGVGGPACRAAGVEILADSGAISAMGLLDVARRLPAIGGSVAAVLGRLGRARPRAALLVNATEYSQRLGRLLRARGVRVLWCVAPQVWAWRPGRLSALRGAFDRMAVILPFEEALWRNAGHDARYVGHPALEMVGASGPRLRRAGPASEPRGRDVAVLPGSRAGEIARLARPLCDAAALLGGGAAIAAPGLDPGSRAAIDGAARAAGIGVTEAEPGLGAAPLLGAYSAALCASGTASLEAAIAGAAPVVAYRLDPLAYAVARRLVRTPHIALPNVLLGRRAYPELIQDECTAPRIAAAARDLLARDDAARLAAELRHLLAPPEGGTFGERVAELMSSWL